MFQSFRLVWFALPGQNAKVKNSINDDEEKRIMHKIGNEMKNTIKKKNKTNESDSISIPFDFISKKMFFFFSHNFPVYAIVIVAIEKKMKCIFYYDKSLNQNKTNQKKKK